MEKHHLEKIHILQLRIADLEKKITREFGNAAKINTWNLQQLRYDILENIKQLQATKKKYIALRALLTFSGSALRKRLVKRRFHKIAIEYTSLLHINKKYQDDILYHTNYIPEQAFYNEELDALFVKKYNSIQEIKYIQSHYS